MEWRMGVKIRPPCAWLSPLVRSERVSWAVIGVVCSDLLLQHLEF